MFDFILKNAALPDGRQNMDIACQGGKIVTVERDIMAQAGETLDANGWLVAPPFI